MQAAALTARRVAVRRTAALTSIRSNYTYALRPWAKEKPKENEPALGDYPRLPAEPKQGRSPHGWDDWQMRRNFGEPLHEYEEAMSMWGPDSPTLPPEVALKHFGIAVLSFMAFGLFIKLALVPERPAVPREYPYEGLIQDLGGLDENRAQPLEEGEQEE